MSVKLTDKEITALAKKMQLKQETINCQKRKEQATKKLPEAKKILQALNQLPDAVLEHLYNKRYSRGSVTAQSIAHIICDPIEVSCAKGNEDYESEVVLAAHDCKSMAELCTKLKI